LTSASPGRGLVPSLGLLLFVSGMIVAVLIFTEVQFLNGIYHVGAVAFSFDGYPSWGERLTAQTCFAGAQGDNCGFLNYAQGLVISLATSFAGFLLWRLYSTKEADERLDLAPSLGLTLLLFGLLIASVVFFEVQVLNGVYHLGHTTVYFEGFPYGTQEVLGSSCLAGSNIYSCSLFNYDQLLFLSGGGAFVGLLLWHLGRRGPGAAMEERF
jgi:hypothetical protein